ncbi:MAG TPA: hypothetical protein VFZ49_10765 [Pyrinomonadaceae bacterium]
MRKLVCIAIFVLAAVFSSHAQRVKINFTPESETFSAATKEYRAIWKSEGDKTIKTLEKVSGRKFRETEFEAIVFEGISRSGRNCVRAVLEAVTLRSNRRTENRNG